MEQAELAWPYPRVRFLSVFLQSLSRLLMMHITFWINVYSVMDCFLSALGERLSGLQGDSFLMAFPQHAPSFSPFSKVGFPPSSIIRAFPLFQKISLR